MSSYVRVEPEAIYDDGSLYLDLGLSPGTLAKARRAGGLRFVRCGHRILYLGRWVIDWLSTNSLPGREGRDG